MCVANIRLPRTEDEMSKAAKVRRDEGGGGWCRFVIASQVKGSIPTEACNFFIFSLLIILCTSKAPPIMNFYPLHASLFSFGYLWILFSKNTTRRRSRVILYVPGSSVGGTT